MVDPSVEDRSSAVQVECPLYVDLDGTLIATDALWESLLLLVRNRPLDLARLPFWALRGKSHFKDRLASRVLPDPARLPYRPEVLEFLREQKQLGRRLVLATASNDRIAKSVAEHLGLFDAVIASNATANLRGSGKLAAIQSASPGPFDYMGDSRADLPLWKACHRAYVVGGSSTVSQMAEAACSMTMVLAEPRATWPAVVAALRPKHWVKNILLFIPLVFAHQLHDRAKLLAIAFAFAAMSLCASAVYVLNDLLDLESDRAHPRKCRRPFACGALSIPTGLLMFFALLAIGFAISLFGAGLPFTGALAGYLAATTAYSLYFKRKLLLDVMVLAGLYTLRILAGGVAADVAVSSWLMAFSMFLFISLAFVKRYSELQVVKEANQLQAQGRSYMIEDLDILLSTGPASGFMAVLVFCLYINSDVVRQLYARPMFLWCICPILVYWITRIWFFARRRKLDDDPVLFALKDRVSWIAGAAAVLLLVLAQPKKPPEVERPRAAEPSAVVRPP